VPTKIVSDRDPLFIREFWRSLQAAFGINLNLNTAYHLQTDGQTERVNRILEDLLRACIFDFRGSWEQHLPLAEFTYNNSYQPSVGMALYEALYERPCKSPNYWWESTEKNLLRLEMIYETSNKIEIISNCNNFHILVRLLTNYIWKLTRKSSWRQRCNFHKQIPLSLTFPFLLLF